MEKILLTNVAKNFIATSQNYKGMGEFVEHFAVFTERVVHQTSFGCQDEAHAENIVWALDHTVENPLTHFALGRDKLILRGLYREISQMQLYGTYDEAP